MDEGAADSTKYEWCTSNLNQNEEYMIKIESTDPMYKYRGDYQILVKLERVVDTN